MSDKIAEKWAQISHTAGLIARNADNRQDLASLNAHLTLLIQQYADLCTISNPTETVSQAE